MEQGLGLNHQKCILFHTPWTHLTTKYLILSHERLKLLLKRNVIKIIMNNYNKKCLFKQQNNIFSSQLDFRPYFLSGIGVVE